MPDPLFTFSDGLGLDIVFGRLCQFIDCSSTFSRSITYGNRICNRFVHCVSSLATNVNSTNAICKLCKGISIVFDSDANNFVVSILDCSQPNIRRKDTK
jgi:hypothetical protein